MTTDNPTQAPFKREDRYIVIKRSHLSEGTENDLSSAMEQLGIHAVDCVVVEADWPEYQPVWGMIEDRVSGGHRVEADAHRLAVRTIIDVYNSARPASLSPVEFVLSTRVVQEALASLSSPMADALERLVTDEEDDPCWRDHNGLCQAHFLEEDCSMGHARDLLRKAGRL